MLQNLVTKPKLETKGKISKSPPKFPSSDDLRNYPDCENMTTVRSLSFLVKEQKCNPFL